MKGIDGDVDGDQEVIITCIYRPHRSLSISHTASSYNSVCNTTKLQLRQPKNSLLVSSSSFLCSYLLRGICHSQSKPEIGILARKAGSEAWVKPEKAGELGCIVKKTTGNSLFLLFNSCPCIACLSLQITDGDFGCSIGNLHVLPMQLVWHVLKIKLHS